MEREHNLRQVFKKIVVLNSNNGLNMCVKELFMLMQQQKFLMYVIGLYHILGYKMLFCVCSHLHFQTT